MKHYDLNLTLLSTFKLNGKEKRNNKNKSQYFNYLT